MLGWDVDVIAVNPSGILLETSRDLPIRSNLPAYISSSGVAAYPVQTAACSG